MFIFSTFFLLIIFCAISAHCLLPFNERHLPTRRKKNSHCHRRRENVIIFIIFSPFFSFCVWLIMWQLVQKFLISSLFFVQAKFVLRRWCFQHSISLFFCFLFWLANDQEIRLLLALLHPIITRWRSCCWRWDWRDRGKVSFFL